MKMLNPKAFFHTVGIRGVLEYIFLALFMLFFYLPLLNLSMLAFANEYEYPDVIPSELGFDWWEFVFGQDSLVSSILMSFLVAIVTMIVSMLICIPAAYALARFDFKGKKIFLLSFLLSNAFPKMGLYISIGIIFYRLNLMGTFAGVVLIHVLNSLMFMTWIPANSFRSVHRQQEESARDAGAGAIRTFFNITMPMAMPGIIVASIFTFLGSLEEAQGTLLVGFPQIKTMPVELYGVIMQYPLTAGPVLSLILIIPSIIILIVLRKYVGPEAIAKGYNVN